MTTFAPIDRAPVSATAARRRRACGFTLIEILIVLAIIGMVMGLGLPAISRVTYQRLNSTTRQFAGMVKTLRNDAILLNAVHRIAIDFDDEKYWIEQQQQVGALLDDPLSPPPPKKKLKKGEPPPPNGFTMAEKYGAKKMPFPSGVKILQVIKEQEGLRKEGLVYVHFFPNGFNEPALITLTKASDEQAAYTLVIRPASGNVAIVPGVVKSLDQVDL